jgi:hypothetical protein
MADTLFIPDTTMTEFFSSSAASAAAPDRHRLNATS